MLEPHAIILIMCAILTCICCMLRRMGKKYNDEIDNVFNEMIPHSETCAY